MITHDLWDIWNFVSNCYLHTKWIITRLAFRISRRTLGGVRRNRRIGIERLISHLRYVPGSKLTHYIGDGEPSHLENRESENKWVYRYIYIPILGWWTVDDHPTWMLWGPVHEESPPRPKRPWLLQLLMRLLSSFNVRFCVFLFLFRNKKGIATPRYHVFCCFYHVFFFHRLNTKATDWGLICLCVYIFNLFILIWFSKYTVYNVYIYICIHISVDGQLCVWLTG